MSKMYSTLRSKEAYVAPALELYTLHTGDLLVDPSGEALSTFYSCEELVPNI